MPFQFPSTKKASSKITTQLNQNQNQKPKTKNQQPTTTKNSWPLSLTSPTIPLHSPKVSSAQRPPTPSSLSTTLEPVSLPIPQLISLVLVKKDGIVSRATSLKILVLIALRSSATFPQLMVLSAPRLCS